MVPPTPGRRHQRPAPISWSKASHKASLVPASANGPPSGQAIRTTGSVQVPGSSVTPCLASSDQIISRPARTTAAGTAPRMAT